MKRCGPDVRAQAIHDLIKSDGGHDAVRRMAAAVVDLGPDNLTGLNSAVREAVKPNWVEAMLQIRINGILSNPESHVANVLGNSAAAIWAVPERFLTAAISQGYRGGDVSFGEAMAKAYGMVQGARDGIKLIASRKKEDAGDVAEMFEMFRPVEDEFTDNLVPEAFGVDGGTYFGKGFYYALQAMKLPTEALQRADEFFKSVGYRSELQALAYREARRQGLDGAERAAKINEILNNPPDDLRLAAFDVARYQTFTNELGPMGKKISSAARSNFLGKIIFPFVRTPVNLVKQGVFERTPLAVLNGEFRADIAAGGTRAAQAEARLALGSMLMMSSVFMALEGRVTGNGPANNKTRQAMIRNGWQPYSVKIGDKWVAYNRLEPQAMILGLGADISEMIMSDDISEEDRGTMVGAASLAIGKNLASKTWMSGAFDFLAAMDTNNFGGSFDRWAINQGYSFVPYSSALRNVARTGDTTLRDTKPDDNEAFEDGSTRFVYDFINTFKRNIPGLSETLPARVDLWGDEIDLSNGLGKFYDFVIPIAVRDIDNDPVDSVIVDNQIPVGMPRRDIEGVTLTASQYQEFVKLAGSRAKEALDQIVKSPGFKSLSGGPDGMQAQIVINTINQYRKIAREEMKARDPDLRSRVLQRAIEKQRAFLGEQDG